MRRADVEDLALAVLAVAVGQLDVWSPVLSDPNVLGPDWLVATAYAVTAGSLMLRRRAPFAMFWVVAGVTTAQALVFGASEGPGSLLPAAVAVYSVAAHGVRQQAGIAAGATLAMVVVRELNNPDNTSLESTANALAWNLSLAAAWLLGRYLRTRHLYTAELADQVRRTAAERAEREAVAAERAAELERARIARELHDVVAHGVSVMVLQADAAEEVIARSPERSIAGLRAIQEVGRQSLSDLRRLLGMLQPDPDAALAPQPGMSRLEEMLDRLRESGLEVELAVEGEAVSLPAGVDLTVYRIVQESLTNTVKHGHARHAWVTVTYQPSRLHVEVRDDGRTPTTATPSINGRGLVGMRERVAIFGGRLETGPDSGPGGGYRVAAALPLEGGA